MRWWFNKITVGYLIFNNGAQDVSDSGLEEAYGNLTAKKQKQTATEKQRSQSKKPTAAKQKQTKQRVQSKSPTAKKQKQTKQTAQSKKHLQKILSAKKQR